MLGIEIWKVARARAILSQYFAELDMEDRPTHLMRQYFKAKEQREIARLTHSWNGGW